MNYTFVSRVDTFIFLNVFCLFIWRTRSQLQWDLVPDQRLNPGPCTGSSLSCWTTREAPIVHWGNRKLWEFPGSPGVNSCAFTAVVQVQSLVRALKSHRPWGTAKKREERGLLEASQCRFTAHTRGRGAGRTSHENVHSIVLHKTLISLLSPL